MKKRIMIDMDDVIVANGLQNMMSDFLKQEVYNDGDNYYIQDLLGDRKKEFFEEFITKNLYDYVEEVEGAFEVIEKLSKKYDIHICTAYIWREIKEHAGLNLNNKYNYLYSKLPFLDPEKFIFTGDKSIVKCEIKIDDKIDNLTNATEKKILFPAFHNRNANKIELAKEGVTLVSGWYEIEQLLLQE